MDSYCHFPFHHITSAACLWPSLFRREPVKVLAEVDKNISLPAPSCGSWWEFLPGEMKKVLHSFLSRVTSRISLLMLTSRPATGGTLRKSRILQRHEGGQLKGSFSFKKQKLVWQKSVCSDKYVKYISRMKNGGSSRFNYILINRCFWFVFMYNFVLFSVNIRLKRNLSRHFWMRRWI